MRNLPLVEMSTPAVAKANCESSELSSPMLETEESEAIRLELRAAACSVLTCGSLSLRSASANMYLNSGGGKGGRGLLRYSSRLEALECLLPPLKLRLLIWRDLVLSVRVTGTEPVTVSLGLNLSLALILILRLAAAMPGQQALGCESDDTYLVEHAWIARS